MKLSMAKHVIDFEQCTTAKGLSEVVRVFILKMTCIAAALLSSFRQKHTSDGFVPMSPQQVALSIGLKLMTSMNCNTPKIRNLLSLNG